MWQFISQKMKSLTVEERRFIGGVVLLVMFLSTLPLLIAFLTQGKEMYFSGYTFSAGSDKMLYFSFMEQARQGKLLLKNLYNTDFGSFRLFSPLWLILGWLGLITHLPNLIIYHLARIIFGVFFLILLYFLIRKIFAEIKWRKIAFLMLCFSSGLGIFTIISHGQLKPFFEYNSIDLWVSESNTFLTLMHSPLFIFSQLIIVMVLWWGVARLKKAKLIEVIGVGLLMLLLGFIHPFDLLIIFFVMSAYCLLKLIQRKYNKEEIFKLVLLILLASQSLIYFFYLKSSQPAFFQWIYQNTCPSLNFTAYIYGYGLILFFYLFGLWVKRKSKNPYEQLLIVWSVVGWLIIYLPFDFQRRLINGLHVPMAILGTIGLKYIVEKFNWLRIRYILMPLLIFFLVITNIFNLTLETVIIRKNHRFPVFIHLQELSAMRWLKDNLTDDDIFLAAPINGGVAPAFSGRTTYLALLYQTNYSKEKWHLIKDWFFATDTNDESKHQWLIKEHINYIYYSALEKSLGPFNPRAKSYLLPVYSNGKVVIFKVK